MSVSDDDDFNPNTYCSNTLKKQGLVQQAQLVKYYWAGAEARAKRGEGGSKRREGGGNRRRGGGGRGVHREGGGNQGERAHAKAVAGARAGRSARGHLGSRACCACLRATWNARACVCAGTKTRLAHHLSCRYGKTRLETRLGESGVQIRARAIAS